MNNQKVKMLLEEKTDLKIQCKRILEYGFMQKYDNRKQAYDMVTLRLSYLNRKVYNEFKKGV